MGFPFGQAARIMARWVWLLEPGRVIRALGEERGLMVLMSWDMVVARIYKV